MTEINTNGESETHVLGDLVANLMRESMSTCKYSLYILHTTICFTRFCIFLYLWQHLVFVYLIN